MARLDAAPRDAVVVSAAAPARPVAGLTLTAMQSWLRVSDAGVRIDADFVVPDRAAATALVERLERERDELVAAAPAECRPKVDALLRDVVVVSGDTRVKAAAFWKPQPLGEAMMCGVGALMKRAEWK